LEPPTASTAPRCSRTASITLITTPWNVGIGFTYKVFTLDLRYSDTNLSKGDCSVFTGAFNAQVGATTVYRQQSVWDELELVRRDRPSSSFSADLTAMTNLK